MLETLCLRHTARYFSCFIFGSVVLLLTWCSCIWAQEKASDKLSVFAAASLKPSLDQISHLFENKHGIELVLSYAGSGSLARQIEYGAPVDIFLSANADWVHHLEHKGLMRGSNELFSNSLVLITNAKDDVGLPFEMTREGITHRLGAGTIALGNVSSVPVGIYAKAALETAGLWKHIQSKVAQTDTVRAALRLVELDEVRMAVVYASDVIGSTEVRILYEFPSFSHPKIVYSGGRLSGSSNGSADLFLNFLMREPVLQLFYERGFLPLH